jgi:hypothetical protein
MDSYRDFMTKTKSLPSSFFRAQANIAQRKENLCSMRTAAMKFRECIAPDYWADNFNDRTQQAVDALQRAISYRNMARNLGRWTGNTYPH